MAGLIALLLYPLVVWAGLSRWHPAWLALCLAALFSLRLLSLRAAAPGLNRAAALLALGGITLCVAVGVLQNPLPLLYYPVMINAFMLALFGISLLSSQSLVERLARLREPDLPLQAVAYTRRVTQVWCLFFICNGAAALYTCLSGNMPLWALYNGGISYLLMGLLMGSEWIIRTRIRRRAPPESR